LWLCERNRGRGRTGAERGWGPPQVSGANRHVRHTSTHHITSHHITSHHITSHHTTPQRITSHKHIEHSRVGDGHGQEVGEATDAAVAHVLQGGGRGRHHLHLKQRRQAAHGPPPQAPAAHTGTQRAAAQTTPLTYRAHRSAAPIAHTGGARSGSPPCSEPYSGAHARGSACVSVMGKGGGGHMHGAPGAVCSEDALAVVPGPDAHDGAVVRQGRPRVHHERGVVTLLPHERSGGREEKGQAHASQASCSACG
jgi:hypothetical protein